MPDKDKDEPQMRLRFRHAVTIDGRDFTAGSVDTVPQSDEAWDAVNAGHADLDPLPGVRGQPFPPDWVKRSEATEAPVLPPAVAAAAAAQTPVAPVPQRPARGGAEAKSPVPTATPPTPDTVGKDPHAPRPPKT